MSLTSARGGEARARVLVAFGLSSLLSGLAACSSGDGEQQLHSDGGTGAAGAAGSAGGGASGGVGGSSGSSGRGGAGPTGGGSGRGGAAGSTGSGGVDAGSDSGGSGGTIVACAAPPQPPGGDPVCGDGWRNALTEECDDGNADETDLCTSACRVSARLVAGPPAAGLSEPPARRLGTGRHAVAARCDGFGVAYAEGDEASVISLSTFDRHGVPSGVVRDVSAGSKPPLRANPVVAGMPDDKFVVAWNDLGGDGDSLGVAMRIVHPASPATGSPKFANAARAFSQYDPDILRVGGEIVVAWADDTVIGSGPDVRFRRFNLALTPATDADETLSKSSASESGVALTSFAASWAAAWKSASAKGEQIGVKAGSVEWQVSSGQGGPLDEKPALVEIDASRLLLAFSTKDASSGTIALRGAVLDSARPGDTQSFAIQPLVVADARVSHNQPSLVRAGERVYLSWRSTSALTGPESEEVWLKEITFSTDSQGLTVDLSRTEVPLPRLDAHRRGIQRAPALAVAPLWPDGAVAAVWEDYGRALGAGESEPDVIVELIPAPLLRLPNDESRRE